MANNTEYIEKLSSGFNLNTKESYMLFLDIMSGSINTNQIIELLTALKMKGESTDEITGAVMAIREKMAHIEAPDGTIDIVGTGGDGLNTLNISTASAIVVASIGIKVAKHGNRSVSSLSGASDILTELGVNINISADSAIKCLNDIDICFMFAPLYHSSFKHVAEARSQLKTRTIFNILGPLCNPANVKNHLIGAFDKKLLLPMSQVLKNLGSNNSWLLHSNDGLDEISISDKTNVTKLHNDNIVEDIIDPNNYRITPAPITKIIGKDPKYNAKELMKVFNGEINAYRDIILINSAAAILISGNCHDLNEGIHMASVAIDSKAALKKVDELIEVTNKLSE
jgi:anthranilate phosphoribosyltransferase